MKPLSVTDMQRYFYTHTWQRYTLLAPNIYLQFHTEMDLCGIRKSGFIDEIEIKTTKADYYADFKKIGMYKKLKHDNIQAGEMPCNYFSFLLPEGLIELEEIPDYAGLYIYKQFDNGQSSVREVKSAKRLHRRKISDKKLFEIGRKMSYKYWHMKCTA